MALHGIVMEERGLGEGWGRLEGKREGEWEEPSMDGVPCRKEIIVDMDEKVPIVPESLSPFIAMEKELFRGKDTGMSWKGSQK